MATKVVKYVGTKKSTVASASTTRHKSVTPGKLLWREFMALMGLTRYRLANEVGVPAERIGEVINRNQSVNPWSGSSK